MNDPQHIWQNQAGEHGNLSLIELREKLRRLHRRIRIQTGISAGIGLIVLDLFVRSLFTAKLLTDRIGWAIVIAGTLCVLLPLIYQNHKIMWGGSLSLNAGLTTCLSFYRNVLERQRRLGGWRFNALGTTLLLAGLAVLLIAPLRRYYQLLHEPTPPSLRPWIPFLILLILWVISFIVVRRRRRGWIRREFEVLEALEKETR